MFKIVIAFWSSMPARLCAKAAWRAAWAESNVPMAFAKSPHAPTCLLNDINCRRASRAAPTRGRAPRMHAKTVLVASSATPKSVVSPTDAFHAS